MVAVGSGYLTNSVLSLYIAHDWSASSVLLYCLQIFIDGFSKTKTIETKSSIFDLVTEYDKKVEQMLIEEISKKFPSHK